MITELSSSVPSRNGDLAHASSRLESVGFYILFATIILAPIAFLTTPYVSIDFINLIKAMIVVVGTLASAIIYACISLREQKVILPPRSILWTAGLVIVSLLMSTFYGTHAAKSFFGQGFEIYTTSFIGILFLLSMVSYTVVKRRPDRAIILFSGMAVSFTILFIFHGLRFIFGSTFATFGVFNSPVATFLGSWNELSMYAVAVLMLVVVALMFLPLSRMARFVYILFGLAAFILAFLTYYQLSWIIAAVVFLGLIVHISYIALNVHGHRFYSGHFGKAIWIPLVAFIVSVVFVIWGQALTRSSITRLNIDFQETTLPWQLTVDVAADTFKAHPILGIGPNRFSQAYISYRPIEVNPTQAWNIEFNSGFGLMPTLIINQGILGAIAWLMFFVFIVICGLKTSRKVLEGSDPHAKFTALASFALVAFFWLINCFYTPSYGIIAYTFVATGILVAIAVTSGASKPNRILPIAGSNILKIVLSVLIVIAIAWAFVYVKKTVAFSYFGSGVKAFSSLNDPDAAARAFRTALSFDSSDLYMRSVVEAEIAKVVKLASTITNTSSASTTQAAVVQAQKYVADGVVYANKAIAYDPEYYYNYLSKAHAFETSLGLGVTTDYDQAVSAYKDAITRNQLNPSIYLSLARLQARANKFDDALATLGAALQVKGNYLDAVFMVSQVNAAKGNLKDAIIAAQFATQMSPQDPTLFFQLGLLQYNEKSYELAASALAQATSLQKDYANAQYFLGLSYARLGKNKEAIEQFQQLAVTNPENTEVSSILTNLKAGRSAFYDAKPPVTPPEKRQTLPIKEKKKK